MLTFLQAIRHLYYFYLKFDLITCAEMPQIKNYKREKLVEFKNKYNL